MKISFHAPSLPTGADFDSALSAAAAAGFSAIDLAMGTHCELHLQSSQTECVSLRTRAAERSLIISSIWTSDVAVVDLATAPGEQRRTLQHDISLAIERARWLGAETVVIGGDAPGSSPALTYEALSFRIAETLSDLRFPAQQHAVVVSILAPAERFLPSPLEARRFIDDVNSPWLSLCLDVAMAERLGRSADWMASLGHRLGRMYLTDATPFNAMLDPIVPVHHAAMDSVRAPRAISCCNKVDALALQRRLNSLSGPPLN